MSDGRPNGDEAFLTVREMVTEIRTDLKELREEVVTKDVAKDHESRLRSIELRLYALPATLIIALAGVAGALIDYWHQH